MTGLILLVFLLHPYVDDFGQSVMDQETTQELIKQTDEVLGHIKLTVKDWIVSNNAPSEKVSEDGVLVMFDGLIWFPELDFWKIFIQSTHFGKKKRGKYPDTLDKFNGRIMRMEEFVKTDLSRRDCTLW